MNDSRLFVSRPRYAIICHSEGVKRREGLISGVGADDAPNLKDGRRVSGGRIRGLWPRYQLLTPPPAPPSGRGAMDTMTRCPSFPARNRSRCTIICHSEGVKRREGLISGIGADDVRSLDDGRRVPGGRIRGVPPRMQLPTPPPAPPSGRGAMDTMTRCLSFPARNRSRCTRHCEERR